MKRILRSLFVLTLLAPAAALAAQPLWNGTEYGMSLEQVKAVVPQASAPVKPSRLYDGSQELLRLEDVELAGSKFAARFYFKDGKLAQVTLSLQEERKFDRVIPVFDALTEAYRAKYGPEITRQIQRAKLDRAYAEWNKDGTTINILSMGVGEHDAMLNINYQVRVVTEPDKAKDYPAPAPGSGLPATSHLVPD